MPNKTIYIRKEDLDKWEAIEDKPRFIHYALVANIAYDADRELNKMLDEAKKNPPTYVGLKDIVSDEVEQVAIKPENIRKSNFSSPKYCKHGQQKGKCIQKDNKDCNK